MTVVSVLPFFLELNLSTFLCIIYFDFNLGIWFTYNSYKLFKTPDDSIAKKLMLSSLVYLPFMQLIYVMDKWLIIWFL